MNLASGCNIIIGDESIVSWDDKYMKALEKLDKDQLIKIILDWDKQLFLIGCICVDESKCHIESKEAVEKIRGCLRETDKYCFYNNNLGAYIDMQLGKITQEEYHKIKLGEE